MTCWRARLRRLMDACGAFHVYRLPWPAERRGFKRSEPRPLISGLAPCDCGRPDGGSHRRWCGLIQDLFRKSPRGRP